jgi:hypothetical protein
MHSVRMFRGAILAAVALAAVPAHAGSQGGGDLSGWVEDPSGSPVSGAVISVFGSGLARGGVMTLTDSSGRFVLPSLPPGSYTLRALRTGHAPARARQVTVLPNQASIFTLSLEPLRDSAAREPENEDQRELRWLVRHKTRSVLEDRAVTSTATKSVATATAPGLPLLGNVGGTFELVASQPGGSVSSEWADPAASSGLVRLQGDLGGHGRWTLSGILAESASTTWRMAAEAAMEPDDGHRLDVGTGYGSRLVRPGLAADSGSESSMGAVFVQERWEVSDTVSTTVAGRYSYVGFVQDQNHFDPLMSVEVRPDRKVRLYATFSRRTLAPGGDVLSVSSTSATPIGFAELDEELRASRTSRVEMGVDRTVNGWTVGGQTFYELVSDQLANDFTGPEANRSLRISNSGDAGIAGVGLSVGRRFGSLFTGSVTYSMGRAWKRDEGGALDIPHGEGDFYDLATRVETAFDGSDTRIVAYYRLNTILPEDFGPAQTSRRFDVQLSQGLPFIGTLTRADWDLLVAVRNIFYEVGEGSTLDELSVTNPPKRVLGGIAVRF